MQSLGQELVVGESFAFLGPKWSQVPTIGSILRAAGVQHAPARLFPLWGEAEIELPGARIKQKPPPRGGLCSIWTDRETYKEGREPIRVIMSDPLRPQTEVTVQLLLEGHAFGQQPLRLDHFGLCLVELQDLPAGRYTLQTEEGHTQTSFTVAQSRLVTMNGTWVQQYTQPAPNDKRTLVFVLQLESFGAPVQGDVMIQLLSESELAPKPVFRNVFRADGAGRVAGDLLLEGDGPFSLEIHAMADKTRWCQMTVGQEGGSQKNAPKRSIMSPLGSIRTWQWSGEGGLLGFEVAQQETWQSTPLILVDVVGQQAVFRAEQAIDQPSLLVLDPITGQMATHSWEALSLGQQIEIGIPRPGGVVTVGGFVEGDPWEGWSLALPASDLQLSMRVLPRHHSQDPLHLELNCNLPETVPVFVVAREEEQEASGAWGPSAALQAGMRQITKEMFVGTPEQPLWKIKGQMPTPPGPPRRNVSPPSAPPPGFGPVAHSGPPSTPPPSGAPMPSTPPPSGVPMPGTPAALQDAQAEPTWQRPVPQHEHFSKTFFCGIVPVTQRHVLPIELPPDGTEVEIEAVALAGPMWAYARADATHQSEVFAELLLPTTCHQEDAIAGEAVIMSQVGGVRVAMWCERQPVPLFLENQPLPQEAWLQEPLNQLTFPVVPGQYVMLISDAQGNELDRVEAFVGHWGERVEEGWGIQFLPQTLQWQSSKAIPAEVLPSLSDACRRVASNLMERPPGHCEVEAARLVAAAYALHYAQAAHEESLALHHMHTAIERLEGMKVKGMGLRMYPGGPHDPKWGVEALKHLQLLSMLPPIPGDDQWRRDAEALLHEASQSYQLPWAPLRIHSARDAFAVYTRDSSPVRQEEALVEVERQLQEGPEGIFVRSENHCEARAQTCYAAMLFLSSPQDNHRQRGIQMVNWVLRQWSAEESGYATTEGVALLALLQFCQPFVPPHAPALVEVDGQVCDVQGLEAPLPFEELSVQQGAAVVGLRYKRLQRKLEHFAQPVPWRVRMPLPNVAHANIQQLEVGERATLTIELQQPGQIGDLVEFLLPPALCWLDGERDEKYFAVDAFEQSKLELPLVAVTTTADAEDNIGPQHWGVRLTNLYDSRRGNAALDQTITVHPPGHRRKEQGVFRRWRKLFG